MATVEIQDYFDSKCKDILASLLTDDNIELLYLFIFDQSKYQIEISNQICDIFLDFDSDYSENEIRLFLKEFFSSDDNMRQFCYELGDVLTTQVFNSDYSGSTTERQLMQYIQTGIFWSLFPKAVKKCLNRNLYTATIKSDIVNGYPQEAIQKCVSGFNSDANTYKLAAEPGLNTLLHKRHYAKRLRTQKKNITRVRKRIKKVVLLYKSKYPRGNAFNNKLNELPDEFISIIRKLFC